MTIASIAKPVDWTANAQADTQGTCGERTCPLRSTKLSITPGTPRPGMADSGQATGRFPGLKGHRPAPLPGERPSGFSRCRLSATGAGQLRL